MGELVSAPRLHVVFGLSAAVDLRQTLVLAGPDDRVVAFPDNLSFGPIDPPDPTLRASWVEAELGYGGWEDIAREVEEFWAAALTGDMHRVAWTSRRSAQDYANFLAFLERLGDEPCDVIDVTETRVMYRDESGRASPPHLVLSPSLLSPYQILENKLLDQAQPLTPQARASYHAIWQRLRAENAALRVVAADLTLTSAPISYFDAALLSHVTERWLKVARVVGETMVKLEGDALHVGDLVLAARVRALAAAGLVEARGDLMRIQFSEIRLPRGVSGAPLTPAN